jgi:hypothetical protein
MRLPLAATLGNRHSTTDKDERILNGLVESQGGKRKGDKAMVAKRPGTVSRYTISAGAGGTIGQALFIMTLPSAPGMPGTNTLIGIRGDQVTIPVV